MSKLGGCNEGWAVSSGIMSSAGRNCPCWQCLTCLVTAVKYELHDVEGLLDHTNYSITWNGTNFLSRLLNKGRYIVTCQRSHRSSHTMPHRIFWWCGGKRARWEKEVVALQNNSHRLKFRSMRLLSTIARVVVAMQFKIFSYFIHKSSDVL